MAGKKWFRKLRLSVLTLSAPAFLLSACVTEPDTSGDGLHPGQPLPSFSIQCYSPPAWDDPYTLSTEDLAGRPSVIVLFNTACEDCRNELPHIQKLYDEMARSVNIICISRSQPLNEVKDYWTANNLTLPVSPQPTADIYRLFARSVIPRVYVCDSQGIIRQIFTDNPIATAEDLRQALLNL